MRRNSRASGPVLPEIVAKPEYQDGVGDKLQDPSKVRVESLHELRNHGCNGQGTKALGKGGKDGPEEGICLPELVPILRA